VQIASQGVAQLAPDSIGNSYFTYAVIIDNPSQNKIASYVSLNIAFFDANGQIVKVDTPTIRAIPPGQKAAVADQDAGAGVVRMTVQSSVQSWEDVTGKSGEFTFTNTTTTPQDFGGLKTTTTLNSSFSQPQSLVQVVAVFYDSAGSIIGGAFTFVDSVPGDIGTPVQIPVEINALTAPPGVARTEVYGAL
jgi:hypothetical protein